MSDLDEFGNLFTTFRSEAFRLESLPEYDIPEERDDLQAFVSGEPLPPNLDEEWLSFLRQSVSDGKKVRRARILPVTATQYLKFEIEWGYVHNDRSGEEIRMVFNDAIPPADAAAIKDFWLFDESCVAVMEYSGKGTFRGVRLLRERSAVEPYIQLRDRMLAVSVPLEKFLRIYRRGEFCLGANVL